MGIWRAVVWVVRRRGREVGRDEDEVIGQFVSCVV